MVCHPYAWHLYALFHSYNNAIVGKLFLHSFIHMNDCNDEVTIIGSICSCRIEMDENRFWNDSEFVFLGLYVDSSKIVDWLKFRSFVIFHLP